MVFYWGGVEARLFYFNLLVWFVDLGFWVQGEGKPHPSQNLTDTATQAMFFTMELDRSSSPKTHSGCWTSKFSAQAITSQTREDLKSRSPNLGP